MATDTGHNVVHRGATMARRTTRLAESPAGCRTSTAFRARLAKHRASTWCRINRKATRQKQLAQLIDCSARGKPIPPLVRRHVALLGGLCLAAMVFGVTQAGSEGGQGSSTVAISATSGLWPNLAGNIARPLRYRPDGHDFVIENGGEFFNRPLYGGNTAFRVDAGDRPEFTLYLPGRGGNLRLGLAVGATAKWLHDAERIVARYRPGAMVYEIRDPLLGRAGSLGVTVLATDTTDGLIVRAEAAGVDAGLEILFAYGGVNGQRGQRDGDIGTEKVPISQYFQLQPEFCKDNTFTVGRGTFTLHSKAATILGLAPTATRLVVADAAKWASASDLLASGGSSPGTPVVVGRAPWTAGAPLFLALRRVAEAEVSARAAAPTFSSSEDLSREFAETDGHFRALRRQVVVETPDPYINAAAAALSVAADGVWDEPTGTVQHGAVAWRSRLLGWRGPYAMDALGWHDRARRHLSYWAGRQNTGPIPAAPPPADAGANLARAEAALHSNGDMSNSHYDMNLVYIDALFRHLLWTGDLEFARSVWPVIERHTAWERRLFRRPFGPAGLPLYEAYAAIWASDDLEYHGGGVAHASAYNYFHNRMAARLAKLIGKDPAPYEREADLIGRAMREYLWLDDRGSFAEFKDLLGLQLVHPGAALWTFYHTLDSGLATPREALLMTRYVDRELPHLPVRGPGVPEDEPHYVLSTTNWMPYSWSVNNVVMGEVVHAALGYWQAGRADEAFRLMKSALLASMFMGICPGNVGSMSYLDVYRRESQRDFADPAGVLSRTLVEGLFGVRPDALSGELLIEPGLPATWDRAALHHPNVDFSISRQGLAETYVIEPRFRQPQTLRLRVAALGEHVVSVSVDGKPAGWRVLGEAAAIPRIEILVPAAARHDVRIVRAGARPAATAPAAAPDVKAVPSSDDSGSRNRDPGTPPRSLESASLDLLDLGPYFNDRVTDIFHSGKYRSPRSPYVSLAIPSQGVGGWAGGVNAAADIDDTGLRAAAGSNGGRIVLPDGVAFATPGPGHAANVVFTSQWDNYPREVRIPLAGRAHHVYLLMAGSTNWMQSRIDNGEVVVTYEGGATERLALHNPTTWWPIDQDYFIDDFAFSRPGPIPPRIDLKTGAVRILDASEFKGKGRAVPGGAATVLDMPLDSSRALQLLTVRALANEVVIGLMSATLVR
jgi:hypothetical protein